MKKYAKVSILSKSQQLDKLFTYKLPTDKIKNGYIGKKVLVPFGRGNAVREGFIIKLTNEAKYKRIKKIKYILDNDISLTKEDIDLIYYIKDKYLATFSEVINLIIPSGTKLKRTTYYKYIKKNEKSDKLLNLIDEKNKISLKKLCKESNFKKNKLKRELRKFEKKGFIKKSYDFKSIVKEKKKKIIIKKVDNDVLEKKLKTIPKSYVAQIRLIKYLLNNDSGNLSKLKKKLKISKSVFVRIKEMGFIDIVNKRDKRKIKHLFERKNREFKKLTNDQRLCYNKINNKISNNKFGNFLLHGVTGSGKTEIYMHLVKQVLKKNKSCIILVPEISLTPQMIKRFMNRFGENIAILHSKLSLGQRFDQWKDIKKGKKRIVIGARSAIFSPVKNLGFIVIDEEHETTYKSERNPKYETYEVAKYRAKQNNAVLLSASATPLIDSYYKTKKNEIELLKLNKRINNKKMPNVDIVDMRNELNRGNKTIFSKKLHEKIIDRLEKNEQIIIFLNRKGYSSFVSCRSCGYALECPNCEISLTYHKGKNEASCSYCDYKSFIPKKCPDCGSKYFKHFGIGTEQVQEIIKKTFKNSKVCRLDSQTTSKKGSLEKIINKFSKNEFDILVGTQMVTKGFDFDNVTLVGVLAADLIINFPDFTSAERAFQLVTQVAGRAGRGKKAGEVVLQTYEPKHYSLIASSEHNYNKFLDKELEIRKTFKYPPFIRLIKILFVYENEQKLLYEANDFKKKLLDEIDENVESYGINEALHNKLRGKYRYQLFFKLKDSQYKRVKESIEKIISKNKYKMYISVDLQPRNLV
ncbi:MAG: primosomal protein N' [Bacillota bacterium]